ncbi:phosphocholine cytidylyltransferase family protein [Streptomyces sp. NPDC050617]|uniref:phosphocholine cytidylyltransferase family protein n=1 Tax=Streptomyces sp. NPDC050617 TaxID=3154628 RepID=UPI00341DE82F
MKAVILAAGRGSRLAPFTDDRPKCLIEVDGRTLLDRQVTALRRAGARSVGVITGWRAEGFAHLPLTRWHNPRWADTTMVDTLVRAEAWLTCDTTLVSYGDIVYAAADASALAALDAPIAVAYDPRWRTLWERRFTDPLADAETFAVDSGGRLTEIGGRPSRLEDVTGQYVGLLRFTPEGWREVRRVLATEPAAAHMTDLLARVVRAGRLPVATVPLRHPWFEFDHVYDLALGRPVVAALDALETDGHVPGGAA